MQVFRWSVAGILGPCTPSSTVLQNKPNGRVVHRHTPKGLDSHYRNCTGYINCKIAPRVFSGHAISSSTMMLRIVSDRPCS
jgi:hypothetical protein